LRQSGFTLLEVVLTTLLLAGGLTLGLAVLNNASTASERGRQQARVQERLRVVEQFLRGRLEAAMQQALEYDDQTAAATFFHADGERLRFVAPMPGYLSRGGPYLQTLRIVRTPEGQRLEFQFQQLGADGPLPPVREPEVLLEGLRGIRFETRALDENGRPGRWQEGWDRPNALPPLLRLRFEARPGQAAPADWIVAPRMAALSAAAPAVVAAEAEADTRRPVEEGRLR
jgi:general secretion pathway protein J